MKKIIILTIFLVFTPFLFVYLFNVTFQEKVIDLNTVTTEKVRVKRIKKDIIETVPLEEYIVGVLAGETPASFDIEALKAQAVASRSYVLKRIEANSNSDYDVVDSVTNQVYLDKEYLQEAWGKDYNSKINKLIKAVNETAGEYLEYDGEVIDALFFSTSNGYTEDSGVVFNLDLPYLKSVDSSWDSTVSSVFNSSATMSLQEFYEKLGLEYNSTLSINNINRSSSNRVTSIDINGKTFKGTDLYKKLSLRSTDFTITQLGTNVEIKMVGFGHGVGMSQYGALGMAQEGYKYTEILSHYYTGTTIKKLEN